MYLNARFVLLMTILILQGCATGTSRIYRIEAPEGSLRLVEVVALATTSDIAQNIHINQPLRMAQKHEALTRDGSVASGRVYCCGGMMDDSMMHYIYVPPDIVVEPGDIVEIKSGKLPKDGISTVNTATRVVQKNDSDGVCRWEPQDRNYGRILYCDWMLQNGWEKYKFGITSYAETWIKRTEAE